MCVCVCVCVCVYLKMSHTFVHLHSRLSSSSSISSSLSYNLLLPLTWQEIATLPLTGLCLSGDVVSSKRFDKFLWRWYTCTHVHTHKNTHTRTHTHTYTHTQWRFVCTHGLYVCIWSEYQCILICFVWDVFTHLITSLLLILYSQTGRLFML